MCNVYIAGEVRGSYRTQYLIKYFLDNAFNVYYNSNKITLGKNSHGLKWIIQLILIFIQRTFNLLQKTYNILIADLVVFPALCNDKQFELKIASTLNKKILSDFYVSLYDSRILDKELYPKDSKIARKLLQNDYNLVKRSTITLFLNSTEKNRYLKLIDIPYNPKLHKVVPLVVDDNLKCQLPYISSNLTMEFSICWWGNYIPLHGLDKILKACQILKYRKIKFHLFLFGKNDSKTSYYNKIIHDLNINSHVSLRDDYTFKNGKLGAFLTEKCDLVLGNFGDSDKAKNVLVNKIIDGVSMMAPVLTGESIAPKEFFKNEIFYCKNTPESIADSITSIIKCPKEEIFLKVNAAYEIYKNEFSPTAFEKKLNSVVKPYLF